MLELRCFGGFQAIAAGAPLTGFVSAKAQALLCYLALTPGQHTRAKLAALLWGERSDNAAHTSLRQALANLRALLPNALFIERGVVGFNPAQALQTDVQTLENALAQTEQRQSQPQIPLPTFDPTVYPAEFLDGFHLHHAPAFEEWQLMERERLHTLAVRWLYLLGAQYAAQARFSEALAASARLLELDPWNEESHRQRMALLANSGNRSAALKQYARCRAMLHAEFNLEPSPETETLYQRIQDNVCLPDEFSNNAHAYQLPFSGREEEYTWLLTRWESARRRASGLTVMAGSAGIGKTRLVQQVLQSVRLQGGRILSGRCYEFNRAQPYQPLHDALQTPLSANAASPLAQLEKLLTDSAPLILFLDDLQWADADTLSILHYLARRTRPRFWLLAAYRPEDTPADHPFHAVCQSLEAAGLLQTCTLAPLTQRAVSQIARTLPQAERWRDLDVYLYRESGGNPLLLHELSNFLIENAPTLAALPDLSQTLARHTAGFALQRIQKLDENSQYLLCLAAAYGQPFDSQLLQAVGECTPSAVQHALETWRDQRLLRQVGEQFDFCHDTIRTALYHNIPAYLRRLIHAQLARALEALANSQTALAPDLLAHHFDRAQNWDKAVAYLQQAAAQAGQMYAHQQAQTCYERSLTIVRDQYPPEAASALEFNLLLQLESVYDIQGLRAEQSTLFARLTELAATPAAQTRVALRYALFAEAVGNYPQAIEHAQLAIAYARQTENLADQAAGYRVWGLALRRQGQFQAALTHYQQARALAEQANDPALLSDALQGLANTARSLEDYPSAREYLHASLELCRAIGDQRSEGDACNSLGLTLQQEGNYDKAEQQFRASLDIRLAIGDQRGMGVIYNNLGQLFLTRAQIDLAEAYFERGLQLCQSVRDKFAEAVSWNGLAQTAAAQKNWLRAQERALKSMQIHRQLHHRAAVHRVIRQIRHYQAAIAPAG